ncbi:MAG: hypothetical protein QOI17_107 [Gaiellales bacterium]|jgi:hypothetical protein|nr:hypothetical protein [Gaiellales bacterium]
MTSAERYRAARDARLAELTGRPSYRRNLALCAIPGVAVAIAGAFVSPLVIVAGLVVAVAGPIGYHLALRSQAANAAKEQVMGQWAAEHGWQHLDSPPLPTDVAFCRDKQRMVAADGFSGPMCDLPGLIFNFTYSTFETRTRTTTDANGNMHTETYTEEVKHRHTVLRLTVGAVAGIASLQLADRGIGFLEKLQAAFGPSRQVDTESVEFNKRFSLTVNDGADPAAVLRIFTPALLVRLINGDFPQTTFQFEQGALAYVWGDQYDVEDLEEVEQRVAAVAPLTQALRAAIAAIL